MVERLISEYSVEPARVDFTAKSRTPISETTIRPRTGYSSQRVSGQEFSVIVPYTGDPALLRYQATTSRLNAPPRASIVEDKQHLLFYIQAPKITPEYVSQRIAAMERELTDRLQWAANDVQAWEHHLRIDVTRAVQARKDLLDHAEELSAVLDIPLAPAPESQQIPIPIRRKTLRVQPASPSPGRDDPRMAEDVYEDVVRTISGMSRSLERLPKAALKLGEEGIRDLLLIVLNANYEGAVRGEVFDYNGKTDILLNWQDRNVFIGECKMWGGQRKFNDAIDQLLSYAAWRDTKAALLLFIQEGNPTEIIKKADAAIRAHAAFQIAAPSAEPDLRQDYLMRSPTDRERYIKMAFLPVVVIPPQ
ncbi:hypothetical protein ACQPYK_20815 [Streptosporangium sp. CA-135522]|uniref:hypothetical protein n=1 Tax=Streptosporangium sp. CA-135522 TaxID=3240072 RepID=UPI003D90F154